MVLGRIGNGRTVAYVLGGRKPVDLGAAELAVPSADRSAVWVVSRGVATRVPLAGGAHRRVPLPPKTRLVADTPSGLIVSAGTVPTRRCAGPGRRRRPPHADRDHTRPDRDRAGGAGRTPSTSPPGTPRVGPHDPAAGPPRRTRRLRRCRRPVRTGCR